MLDVHHPFHKVIAVTVSTKRFVASSEYAMIDLRHSLDLMNDILGAFGAGRKNEVCERAETPYPGYSVGNPTEVTKAGEEEEDQGKRAMEEVD